MYMTDTFCSFMRNVILKSCFLLLEYGSIAGAIFIKTCGKKLKIAATVNQLLHVFQGEKSEMVKSRYVRSKQYHTNPLCAQYTALRCHAFYPHMLSTPT